MVIVQKRPGHYHRMVRFEYKSPKKCKQVSLVGSFNGWNANMHLMRPNWKGLWELIVHLPPGQYEYKFVVDGYAWELDPSNEGTTVSRIESKNSLLKVA